MVRHLTLVAVLLALFLAACTATPVPAQSEPVETPTTAVDETATETETEPTAVVEESETVESETEEAEPVATEAPATEPAATEEMTTTVEAEVSADCPVPSGDTQLVNKPAAGYCFLIPADFALSEFSQEDGLSLGIYGPESTPGHRERGFVDVSAATTQTLEGSVQVVVDDVLAALPGFTPTQTSLTLGGLPAIQLDNLPGQDLNRKVFAVNEGRVYQLTFLPIDETRADATAEMEELYQLVVDSFTFIPVTETEATTGTLSTSALLTWEGEIDGACHTLTIQASGEAAVAVCGDEPTNTTTIDAQNVEWTAVQQHFGAINAETPAGKIVFQGQGNATNDRWAQALATWASFTAMELNAGRSSASVRTALAWQLTTEAEHSGQCSQLVVLAYGYAYANLIPCEGSGQSTQVAAGWLSDSELDTFFDWLANGARVEGESGYLDAKGNNPVTPEEINTWANAIYARMIQ